MFPQRVALLLAVAGLACRPGLAAGYRTRDRPMIDLAATGLGPGIPVEGEGLALGGSAGLFYQDRTDDAVLVLRPAATYHRAVGGWADDERTIDLAGLSLSIGMGVADLGRFLPYMAIGVDPTIALVGAAEGDVWDWSLGIHAEIGLSVSLGAIVAIRPAVGYASLLFSDIDRPIGGLRFSLALAFDLDPDVAPRPRDPFRLDVSYTDTPGRAVVEVIRESGFADAVVVWAEAPEGVTAVVVPGGGPDRWSLLVGAGGAWCDGVTVSVMASSGDRTFGTDVWFDRSRLGPECGPVEAP